MLPRRLATTTALLRRSTVAGTPAIRRLIPRRLLATPPATGDEQADATLSIPKVAGIPIANNYETGVSGYNHPDPEMVWPASVSRSQQRNF